MDATNDDLYEHYHFVAGSGQIPLRVDKFLMNFVENATRNKIQEAAKEGSGWGREKSDNDKFFFLVKFVFWS